MLGGIRKMKRPPGVIFIVDPHRERIAVTEANKLEIPVVGTGDTNVDPDELDYIIPANDDAIRSIRLLCQLVADAAIEGARERAARASSEAEVQELPAALDEPEFDEAAAADLVAQLAAGGTLSFDPGLEDGDLLPGAPKGDGPAPEATTDASASKTAAPATEPAAPPAAKAAPAAAKAAPAAAKAAPAASEGSHAAASARARGPRRRPRQPLQPALACRACSRCRRACNCGRRARRACSPCRRSRNTGRRLILAGEGRPATPARPQRRHRAAEPRQHHDPTVRGPAARPPRQQEHNETWRSLPRPSRSCESAPAPA